jgi:hypothetical protein
VVPFIGAVGARSAVLVFFAETHGLGLCVLQLASNTVDFAGGGGGGVGGGGGGVVFFVDASFWEGVVFSTYVPAQCDFLGALHRRQFQLVLQCRTGFAFRPCKKDFFVLVRQVTKGFAFGREIRVGFDDTGTLFGGELGRSIGRQLVNIGRGAGRDTVVVAAVFQVKGMHVAKSDGLFEFEPCKGVGARDKFVHGLLSTRENVSTV